MRLTPMLTVASSVILLAGATAAAIAATTGAPPAADDSAACASDCCAAGATSVTPGDTISVGAVQDAKPWLDHGGDAAFEMLKQRLGTWVTAGPDGEPTDEVMSELRLTAGGSAIIETMFPGQPHEMISMYHVEDGHLHMVHYCVLKNRPHLVAHRGASKNELVWQCGPNDPAGKDGAAHMGRGVVRYIGLDRISSDWNKIEHGEVAETMHFELVRKPAAD